MSLPDLEKLRQSGRISARTREHCKQMIQVGARLEDIARAAEAMIVELGGKPAFPAQLSRNHIAAHYCSPPGDATVIQAGDIVKLDLGTHVDGYVTDNAVTVDLGAGAQSALVAASQTALENAIALMGPGASLTEIGGRIEDTIKAFGFNPVFNLTGHGVARYVIHCQPTVPNYRDRNASRLRPHQTIACEPFASDGAGYIESKGKAEVFGLKRRLKPRDRVGPELTAALEACEGLPFARRTLLEHLGGEREVENGLRQLRQIGVLIEYPPLVEKGGVRVAQTEHTIYIHETGAEVLTRAPD
ncbi:MAG: type II methionyl aminopeptidase [Planctomycetota bacterium]